MNIAEFEERFPRGTRIGSDVRPELLSLFYDNGKEVGVWRYCRRTTQGRGEILNGEQADMARSWYAKGQSR